MKKLLLVRQVGYVSSRCLTSNGYTNGEITSFSQPPFGVYFNGEGGEFCMPFEGDVSLIEEIAEQDFDGVAYGACTTNTFSLSDHVGNNGGWCTLTKECQPNCN
ncbi:plantaricin C family lantibiotic [Streptomyces sp. NPDC050161]|uniref:plantaricin C family lantibiotic n=1 Tax=unclassified Streptomyces TaxID=2593676 RepID=UPI00371539E6